MLKRMLVGLVLVCGFGIGAIDSFAFDTAKNLEKEAQLEAKKEIKKEIKKEAEAKLETTTKDTKSEPHFDLPKKDEKEQCAEVERVDYVCGANAVKAKAWETPYRCGNVYIKLAEVYYTEYGCGDGTNSFILNNLGNIIGILNDLLPNKTILFGKDMENLECIYSDERKKHKKQLKNSKIIIEVDKCYAKEIKNHKNY